MREFIVRQTSLNLKWTFERMLPSLPGPGTEAFSNLVKALHPYGINPSMVAIDAPSSRLGDVTLTISRLLEGRLGLRLTPGDVEFFLEEYLVDDDEKIVIILNEFFAALKIVNEVADKGSGYVKSSSHLELAPQEAEALIREHVNISSERVELVPDAVGYDVNLGEGVRGRNFRLILAKSVKYENSAFVDISATYDGVIDPAEFFTTVTAEFARVTELVGLTEKPETAS